MRGRARDLVLLALFLLTETHDGVLEGKAGAAAWTRRVPVDRYLVTGDDPAPVALVDHVVDGEPTGFGAGAGQRLTGFWVEDERDDPRLKVIPALLAREVHAVVLRKRITLLDSHPTVKLPDDVHVTVGQNLSLGAAAGEYGRVRRKLCARTLVQAGRSEAVHEVVGACHEYPLAAQLVGHARDELGNPGHLPLLHRDQLVLACRQLGIELQATQFALRGRGAHLVRQEH